jgi:hypothetical protein
MTDDRARKSWELDGDSPRLADSKSRLAQKLKPQLRQLFHREGK